MKQDEALATMGAKFQELAEKNLIFPDGGVCNPPVIVGFPQRVMYYHLSDFCLLNTIRKELVDYLLDHAEKGVCQIVVAVWLKNSCIPLPHLQSLDPSEIRNIRKNPLLKTIIVLDRDSHSIFVDLNSLLISKFEADRLLDQRAALINAHYKNQQSEKKDEITLSNEENVLRKRFEMSLIENIESINPSYNGKIHEKTQAPHKLTLIVMSSMIELAYSHSAITWGSIKVFIRKHLANSQNLKKLSGYNSLTDDYLRVENYPAPVKSLKSRVSDYKRNVFKIS